jgi:2-dehydro-3-deoxy-D-arabinonate dehydratase
MASDPLRTPETATMKLCKVQTKAGETGVGVLDADSVRLLGGKTTTLSGILHGPDPEGTVRSLLDPKQPALALTDVRFLPPVDQQEVWAAGVTYKRSREARERESAGAAQFYEKVYTAERPELFLKATPRRVVGTDAKVRIRKDGKWNVPEPEVTLVISPQMQIVGYTIGNDMSSRDIEGENPLYLPQAKIYNGSCALGPVVTLAEAFPPPEQVTIEMLISRAGQTVFDGQTTLAQMARSFTDLVSWLGRENTFPDGVILLTGTGVVPPDNFTLQSGDRITIEVAGIGRLCNTVE